MHSFNNSAKMDNPLSTLEAERIISVLEDTSEKLGFLDSITPDILQHRDELSKFIGDEIARIMNEQQTLEKRYEFLIEQRSSMKGMINKSKYKEIQEEIQDISRALRESTNNLVRSLKENPNVSGNMIKVQRDRTELHDLLLRCIQELRDKGSFGVLTHKVDEEKNSRIRVLQLKSHEKSLRETVSRLEIELADEERSFKRITAEQNLAIAHLKDEMKVVKGSTSTDARFKRKESLASVSSIWRECKLKERVFETKLKELEEKLQTENVVHGDTKSFLLKKHVALQEEIAKWETKYENDVGHVEAEIKLMTTRRTNQLEKLSRLQTRRDLELAQERDRMEASQMAEDLEKQRVALLKQQNRAARVIQRKMRAFFKRQKELAALLGDKKKKGGNGKGGKKKGKK